MTWSWKGEVEESMRRAPEYYEGYLGVEVTPETIPRLAEAYAEAYLERYAICLESGMEKGDAHKIASESARRACR